MKRNYRPGRLKNRLLAMGLAATAGICALFAPPHEDADVLTTRSDAVRTAAVAQAPEVSSRNLRLAVKQEETRAEKLRRVFFALSSPLKALLSLPLVAVGKLLLFFMKKLFAVSNPLAAFLLGFAARVLMLAAMFALVWKLLFPKRPLSALFKNGRWRWLLAGAALVTAADRLLTVFSAKWRWIRILIGLAAAFLVTALLYNRLFKGVRAPERAEKWIDIPQTV